MKKYINKKFPHFLYGADYNPEQWIDTKQIWNEDMRLMKLANCNEMTVGIFSWATIEPEEDKFDFSFLDEIIDKIYENGGRVILATPSGSRPRWLAERYPEVLRVNEDGTRNLYGMRHNHCYTSPAYRERVRIINTELAKRYGSHQAVYAWHLSNEYGGKCFCDLCQKSFREFIRRKYNNDITALNKAYWTSFWGHEYSSFDQIEIPVKNGERSIHGLNLDFNRFCSEQTIDFMREEALAVKAVCPEIPVTTNMMYEYGGVDYRRMKEELDFISWDCYPEWHSPEHYVWAYKTAFWHELFRSLKKQPFLLMESAPGLVNWHKYNKLKRPNMDRLAAMQAIAMGSDSVQYFQWRKGRGGTEKFHGAVVDHAGTENTRIFKTVSDIGSTLKTIDEICGTTVDAKVALIYDWENKWALDNAQMFSYKEKRYNDICALYYRAFWERGINVDMVGRNDDLSSYALVVAPMLYMAEEKTVNNLKKYVEGGGTLYATYLLGMVDDTDLCHLGGFPAGELKNVFGIWNEELDTLYSGEQVLVKAFDGSEYKAKNCCELIHTTGAEVLAVYDSEFYKGMPALTVNNYGKGKAYYQAFRDCSEFWDRVCSDILRDLEIKNSLPCAIPENVTAHIRKDGEQEYLFVQNYGDTIVEEIPLGHDHLDMETGNIVSSVALKSYDVKILKRI